MAWANGRFAQADTWVMSRPVYEAVVPWWEKVARGELPEDLPAVPPAYAEFAAILAGMRKIAVSRSLPPGPDVLAGDVASQLAALKAETGRTSSLRVDRRPWGRCSTVPGSSTSCSSSCTRPC